MAGTAKRRSQGEDGLVEIALNYGYIIRRNSIPVQSYHCAAGDLVPSRQLPGVNPVTRLKARMKAVSDS